MFIKFRIKMLEKKLNKLKKQHRKNDEIIKFLGRELFKACDETYNLQSTPGLKSIHMHNFKTDIDKVEIENQLTGMRLSTKLKGE